MTQTDQLEELIEWGCGDSFYTFFDLVIATNIPGFVTGPYVEQVCSDFQTYKKLMLIAGRGHIKTTLLIAWMIYTYVFQHEKAYSDHFICYTRERAGEHLTTLKEMVEANPILNRLLIDENPTADKLIAYRGPFGILHKAAPTSINSFVRGSHTDRLIGDDLLTDPTVKLEPKAIEKVNEAMRTQLVGTKNPGAEVYIVGTTQTQQDFFYDKDLQKTHKLLVYPARKKDGSAQWPERWYKEALLEAEIESGPAAWAQEFMCIPAYATDGLIKEEAYDACVDPDLKPYALEPRQGQFLVGVDTARKKHPTYVTVFELYPDKMVQRVIIWLDRVSWDRQTDVFRDVANCFSRRIRGDDTRGEFTMLKELEPQDFAQVECVNFSERNKGSLASTVDKLIGDPTHENYKQRLVLLPDERQKQSVLSVQRDLQAAEWQDSQGNWNHGDALWGIGLAVTTEFQYTTQPSGGKKRQSDAERLKDRLPDI